MKKMKEMLNEIRFRDDSGNILRLSDKSLSKKQS